MSNFTAFLDVNKRLGRKNAVIFPSGDFKCTYEEMLETVCRRSSLFLKSGISRGDRVCIYLPSVPEYLFSYLALWRIGAVAVPLNIVLCELEIKYMLENSGASAIISGAEGRKNAEEACSMMSSKPLLFITGDEKWDDALSDMPSYIPPVNCLADDLCQLQYTSGTTGKQKGAMLTHGNWMAAMESECGLLNYCQDDVYLGIYPMAHVGVSWGISALKAGATWVIMEKFDLDRYIRYSEQFKVTVIAGMPPVIHSLLNTDKGSEKSFSTVREMISGGGPLHPSVWKEFYTRFHTPVVNAYGLSETIVVGTGTAIRPEDYKYADEFKSVGYPVGYTEMKIVDTNDSSKELENTKMGEIALRGPAVAKGYWRMEAETKKVFLPDGWFLTGDIGFIDEDGMLAITDRKKDMIVMSGWKIYPTEVEKVYIEHPDIDDIAIFGCPDIHRGEVPVAAVVTVSGKKLSEEDLINFGMERLARYKVPRSYIFLDRLPRVNGWKLLRRELRDSFCSEEEKEFKKALSGITSL
ncbi:long-chain acyl-CoA synthetase [Methanomicrobium sp. W14]|uniref:class I adenylate-forming enzyme family protein n=1 Tax=Methanomicrobium sp. W14 TaxID=2817839 RepID=UPI001AE8C11E|nr:AMP-binding protein [Methanomicrobium sp. W14]MBP2132905.1 long-chain acyl-CoA synthetase [Methanomicrobium sp. W14]